MSDTSQHALLGASGAHRTLACLASLKHGYMAPRRSNRYADDGTASHELLKWCLDNKADPANYPHPTITVDGVDYPVDDERVKRIRKVLKVIAEYAGDDGYVMSEQKVSYGRMLFGDTPITYLAVNPHTGETEQFTVDPADLAWGTGDVIIIRGRRLIILDLKDGMKKVEVAGNVQFRFYALGALYEFGMLAEIDEIVMVVAQPKLDYFDEDVISVEDLHAFAAEAAPRLMAALETLSLESGQLTREHYAAEPDDKICGFCDHNGRCPATTAVVTEDTRDFFAAFVDPAVEAGTALVEIAVPKPPATAALFALVDDDRLSQAMSKIDLIEAYCKAVRAEVERRLLAGQPVAGFKLVEGRRGDRKWVAEESAEGLMKSFRLKQEDMYDFKLKSPTSMEKALKDASPKRWTKLQALITRADGEPSVAPASDKREPLVITSVEDAFAALVEDVAA